MSGLSLLLGPPRGVRGGRPGVERKKTRYWVIVPVPCSRPTRVGGRRTGVSHVQKGRREKSTAGHHPVTGFLAPNGAHTLDIAQARVWSGAITCSLMRPWHARSVPPSHGCAKRNVPESHARAGGTDFAAFVHSGAITIRTATPPLQAPRWPREPPRLRNDRYASGQPLESAQWHPQPPRRWARVRSSRDHCRRRQR